MNIVYPGIRLLPTPYGLILCAFHYGKNHSSSNLPEIPLPMVRMQCDVTKFFAMSCPMLYVAVPLA